MIPNVIGPVLEKYGDHSDDDETPTHQIALHAMKMKRTLGNQLRSLLSRSHGQCIVSMLDQCAEARLLARFPDCIADSRLPGLRKGRPSDFLQRCGPPGVMKYIKGSSYDIVLFYFYIGLIFVVHPY